MAKRISDYELIVKRKPVPAKPLPKVQQVPPMPVTYVTPYLSDAAKKVITEHERWNKMPAFVLAMERHKGSCPNCGGGGVIYVRLCASGPHKSPLQKLAVTYFDGDGIYPPGWYTIKETQSFPCGECKEKEN